MQIAANKVVSIDYTLTDDNGTVIDTSEGRGPLLYLAGAGNIIPGLEKALEGKSAGDSLQVKVSPEEGYGDRHEQMVQEVPKDAFQGVEDIQVGMQFHAESDHGPLPVVVVGVSDETVTVDGNHPLAGENLNFDVTVVEVRDASDEEMAHGHVHGPGGHEH